jgi:hypothetical protein
MKLNDFFDFLDTNYKFKSFKSKNNEKHLSTKSKPTEYVLTVLSKLNDQEKEYKILYKNGDDSRKDFLIFQSLELIKKVRFIIN